MTYALTQVADALNLSALPKGKQEMVLLDIHALIFKNALVRLLERMNERNREELLALIEEDASEGEIEAFIETRVPGAQSAVAEAIMEVTGDILSVTKQ